MPCAQATVLLITEALDTCRLELSVLQSACEEAQAKASASICPDVVVQMQDELEDVQKRNEEILKMKADEIRNLQERNDSLTGESWAVRTVACPLNWWR